MVYRIMIGSMVKRDFLVHDHLYKILYFRIKQVKQCTPFQVIYLTGPPATGKSTLTSTLQTKIFPLEVYSYSKVLSEYVNKRSLDKFTESDIRQFSSNIISPNDVEAVDQLLIEMVTNKRDSTHIIIDSHAVTKEKYGFRITPFKISMLTAIRPTMICMLYSEASVVIKRIKKKSQGRPLVSVFEKISIVFCSHQSPLITLLALVYQYFISIATNHQLLWQMK